MKEHLDVTPLDNHSPLVGRWLAYMNLIRERTLEDVGGLSTEALDHTTPEQINSIGTLLYHIAVIELNWLYCEILEQDFPKDIMAHFPYDDRDETGRLTQVRGWELGRYLEVLELVRNDYIKKLKDVDDAEFLRPRELPSYVVTPEWVCWHLLEHEAGHLGQIRTLKTSLNT